MDWNHEARGTPLQFCGTASLIALDSELATDLDVHRRDRALRNLLVPVYADPGQPWADGLPARFRRHFGLVITEGIMQRVTTLARRPCIEVLGPGDLVRPSSGARDNEATHAKTIWSALRPTRFALLDADFVATCAEWPEVVNAIVARHVERAHWRTAIRSAMTQARRVDQQLLLLLWHFAQRWGVAEADGVHVRIPLRHETLAALVGAQRPAVAAALKHLDRVGALSSSGETWVVGGEPPEEFALYAGPRVADAPTSS